MQPNAVKEGSNASPSQAPTAGGLHWLTFFLLVAVAAGARFYCLACKPFWFDEAFSVEVAKISGRNFLHLMWWREANMSLYYVLLRAWLVFGHSPFFIRSLSALISTATLPAIYWLSKLLFNRRVALLATALLAVNAYSIRYAQEARSYALFVLLATLSSGFFIASLRTPSRRTSKAYIICSVLAVYAHFYALLLIAAHWLSWRLASSPDCTPDERNGEALRQIRRAWVVIGIAVLPLLVFVGKTGAGPIKWISRPGFASLWQFGLDFTNSLPIIYLLACLLALFPVRKELWSRGGDWQSWRIQFLIVWLLLPVALTVLLSFLRPVFLPRYLIFCIPALLILAAAGIEKIRAAWLNGVFAAVLLLSAHYIPFVYSHDFDNERDASGTATNFILDHCQPADGILFHIAETRVSYEFFRSLRLGTAQPGPEIIFPIHDASLNYQDFTGKPTEQLVRSEAGRHTRVWLMLMHNGTAEKPDPTTVMLSQVLPESLPRMRRWQFARVEVRLYSKE